MTSKLPWQKIRELYPDEWVELLDYEWSDSEIDPHSGVVRDHSRNRKELHQRFMNNPVDDSAIVFTGKLNIPEGTIFSSNLHQYGSRK